MHRQRPLTPEGLGLQELVLATDSQLSPLAHAVLQPPQLSSSEVMFTAAPSQHTWAALLPH